MCILTLSQFDMVVYRRGVLKRADRTPDKHHFTQIRNMEISYLFLLLYMEGVFGDEVKSVSVMEGDSVTLHTDITDIQTADRIVWIFGPENDRIAQINRAVNKISIYDDVLDGRFRDRLQVDVQTGDLIITNITTQHSGLYKLQIISGTKVLSRRFRISLSFPLPVPVITSDCSPNSSSNLNCSLLCSVMNVTDVSLSWYKGNSLLSIISVSDLNIRLSLPLEVEYQDTNTYRCVLNNTITNQTQHLNITHLCQLCSVKWPGFDEKQDSSSRDRTILKSVVVVVFGLLVVGAVVICIYRKFRKTDAQTSGEEHINLNGLCAADEMKTVTDGVKNITVKAGDDFTLDTGVKDIQTFDLIQWKFADLSDTTNPFVPIVKLNKNSEDISDGVIKKLGEKFKINNQTGSITVKNSKPTDTGLYKLEININTNPICKSFVVTVSE